MEYVKFKGDACAGVGPINYLPNGDLIENAAFSRHVEDVKVKRYNKSNVNRVVTFERIL